ncbi:lanthionine synthetase C family protein [Pendulispora brunnea]|uniref:Lanthionine synthetase C family protein n=1 Tax=Pendulispora brunnea TaxID=2905690 RepID=A0ABZ2KAD3_9BACT
MSARDWVHRLAERLRDPAVLAGNAEWYPTSLGDGHPGIALLFATLAREDPAWARAAHAHLSAALSLVRPSNSECLFVGMPAVAFAARASAQRPGEYAKLLKAADQRVAAQAERILAADGLRLRAGVAGVPMAVYDVVLGLSGLGRYLLACGPEQEALTERILVHLAAFTRPLQHRGRRVPGWLMPDGQLNLGLAHGIPGPLALLALAYEMGIRIPNHEEAIRTIVEWILARQGHDEHGPYWPAAIPLEYEMHWPSAPLPPTRTAWCYGAPGIARALHLASRALGESSWCDAACAALESALRRPPEQQRLDDATLCHGHAGLARIVGIMAQETGSNALYRAHRHLVSHLIEQADDESPFIWSDRPGFLEGGVGVALTLHEPADSASSRNLPWEAALLLQ